MLSHVIPQCLVTDRITIKLQLTGKSRLIFKFYLVISPEQRSHMRSACALPISIQQEKGTKDMGGRVHEGM